MKSFFLALCFLFLTTLPAEAAEVTGCSAKGHKLYGRVKVVDAFPDLRVQVVSAFPDLRVGRVTAFADSCGEWEFVDSFPDFTIQYVDSFPDIKIQFVTAFPGTP